MQHKLYTQLAPWWHVLSHPSEYVEEAALYARELCAHGTAPARTLLELGSGGGNNASHLEARFELTLVDLSPRMLEQSRALNPECEHVQGDMRSVRLGRQFDRVFIQDAIAYMTSEQDLRSALRTAFVHCRPGGAALFAPDHVRETFRPETSCGGNDAGERALRYLAWTWDPDPGDDTCVTDYVYVLRDARGNVQVEHDRHVEGLFSRATWLRLLREVGFEPLRVPLEHSELPAGSYEVFLGVVP